VDGSSTQGSGIRGCHPGLWVVTLERMRTLVLDPPTAGLGDLLGSRRRSGLDRLDEVWDGVYHMVAAPSGAHGA
jgi:hypothetical protein